MGCVLKPPLCKALPTDVSRYAWGRRTAKGPLDIAELRQSSLFFVAWEPGKIPFCERRSIFCHLVSLYGPGPWASLDLTVSFLALDMQRHISLLFKLFFFFLQTSPGLAKLMPCLERGKENGSWGRQESGFSLSSCSIVSFSGQPVVFFSALPVWKKNCLANLAPAPVLRRNNS